jgi:hypothetical protein
MVKSLPTNAPAYLFVTRVTKKKKFLAKSPIKIRKYLNENFPGFNQFFANGFAFVETGSLFPIGPRVIKKLGPYFTTWYHKLEYLSMLNVNTPSV